MFSSKARLHWIIFAILYTTAVVVTYFWLCDATITWELAHHEWELMENVAVDLTLAVWGVVLAVVLLVHFSFRLFATPRRKA